MARRERKREAGSALHILRPRHGGLLITRRPYDHLGHGILYLYLYSSLPPFQTSLSANVFRNKQAIIKQTISVITSSHGLLICFKDV